MESGRTVEVALIGGGRRGKLLCRVLAQMRRVRKVHLVSRQNARGLQDWLAGERLVHRVELHAKLDPVLWSEDIAAAIVANDPAEHFTTARWLLENGKHVLVEKPFADTRAEAQALIDMAEARGLVAAAGFEFFLASYLHYFRSIVHNHGHPHPVEQTEITWHDVARGERWGAMPWPGERTHVIADLLPHVLTLLTVLFGHLPARTTRVVSPDGRRGAQVELLFGTHPVKVALARTGEPRRVIRIATRGGPSFLLDFTTEPGTVTRDGRLLPPDCLWDSLPRPVPAGLAHFLDEVRDRRGSLPLLARQTLHIVEGTEDALARSCEQQASAARAEAPRAPYVLPLTGAPAIAESDVDPRAA
jgi:predicted dehydrogenase